jgi:predicted HAD superfamily phosphohydrolase
MRSRSYLAAITLALLPSLAAAQGVVAEAFRNVARDEGKNLTAAAEVMPTDKYSYKPTPKQMSFGEIIAHLAQGNDFLCGSIGGTKAPERSKVTPTASKDALVARLKETFQFCDQALANLDDSKLGEQLPMFGGKTMSRAAVEMVTVGDWADHYSQIANYLRLNGLLPPTAMKKM